MSVLVLGSINLDTVFRVARLPAPGETIMALGRRTFAGGKGANQAAACAAWGSAAALIGAVGQDAAGERLIAHLEAAGVDASMVSRLAGLASGRAFICVSAPGENTIVVDGGANRAVTPANIEAAHHLGAAVLLAQQETDAEAVRAFFARPGSGLRILNAAPADRARRDIFNRADLIVVNETELRAYVGGSLDDVGDVVAVGRSLIARQGQTLIVTLGARGALAVGSTTVVEAPARRVEVVDATGAGDCFCGVLAASLDQGETLETALRNAVAAASLSTTHPGAAVSRALRAEVRRGAGRSSAES